MMKNSSTESETQTPLTEIEILRKENERLRKEKELLELEKKASKGFTSEPKTNKLGPDAIKELIPIFDPSTNDINSKQWTEVVDDMRNTHDWDNRSTLLYASYRLEKAARSWYLSRGAGIVRWNEFKDQLIETFPSPPPPIAPPPPSISSPQLPPLPPLSSLPQPPPPPSINVIEEDPATVSNRKRKRDLMLRDRICFQCREHGHYAKNCSAAKPKEPTTSTYEMRGIKSHNDGGTKGLLKEVNVDGVVVKAEIDLGSDCTTLKLIEAFANQWDVETCSVKLNGFGGSCIVALGKLTKLVTVDEVSMLIDIYIVPNSCQDVPMIVGRNFLNSPEVCVVKKFGSLEVKCATEGYLAVVGERGEKRLL